MMKRITVDCPGQLYFDFNVDVNEPVKILSVVFDEKSEKDTREDSKEIRL